MLNNSQTILKEILEKEKALLADSLSESKFFELFASEQILKNYGLSYDEIQSGIVGNGNDGGVDSLYTFVNGVLVVEDADFKNIRQNALISLYIVQSKKELGFSVETILKFEDTSKDLLNLSHQVEKYSPKYNPQILRSMSIFRNAYTQLISVSPQFRIYYWYVTLGDQVHPNVKTRADGLIDTVRRIYTESEVEFHFCGADELLTRYRKAKVETLSLTINEVMPTQLESSICLVNLSNYYELIADLSTGELRGWLFEENVRDYEGRNIDVNKDIRSSLEVPVIGKDFWWLNNGITIVASRAPLSGKTVTMVDPKIVNGLQTSMEIYNYYRSNPHNSEIRNILVRIIVADDQETRNAIIKATNSQSSIKPASLRAFDPIHHKIEQYFLLHDLYYDRRKNYYKNQSKPKDKIITITYLSQAIAAIMLQRPNDSRGRPINLIKNQKLYDQIFSENQPIELFLACYYFMKRIDDFLYSDSAPKYIVDHEFNIRYQLAMFVAAIKAKRMKLKAHHILATDFLNINNSDITKCTKHVWTTLQKLRGKKKDLDEDRVAKSPEFDEQLKKLLSEIIVSKTKKL